MLYPLCEQEQAHNLTFQIKVIIKSQNPSMWPCVPLTPWSVAAGIAALVAIAEDDPDEAEVPDALIVEEDDGEVLWKDAVVMTEVAVALDVWEELEGPYVALGTIPSNTFKLTRINVDPLVATHEVVGRWSRFPGTSSHLTPEGHCG